MKGLRDASFLFAPPGITYYVVAKGNAVTFFDFRNRNKIN